MKISQIAKKYDISIDTINYYVSYGLLVPPRKGAQRIFDERTERDLEMILELRALEFTLQEIHRILSLYRVSSLASRQDAEDLRKLYTEKKQYCQQERKRLSGVVQKLERKIDELQEQIQIAQPQVGLPISMLDLLCCPECGGALNIRDVNMNQRYIYSGTFQCACGYCAEIQNGIMLTPNKNKDVYDKPDVNRDTYKNLPPHLISLYQVSYNWMIRQLERMDLRGKVVLETHVNAWFFMHNHQEYLDPQGKYIVIDKYPETLAMYKNVIDQQGYGRDILYIADSGIRLPVKKECIDLDIDFFAVNEHYFYWDSFLLEDIKPHFAKDARMLGTYFYFREGHKSMKTLLAEYPTCSKYNFNREHFEKELARSGFEMLEQEDSGYTTSSGNNIGFSFHSEGERMYLMPYFAKMAR